MRKIREHSGYTFKYFKEDAHIYSVYKGKEWLGSLHPNEAKDTWVIRNTLGIHLGFIMFRPLMTYGRTIKYNDRLVKAAEYLYNSKMGL